MLVVGWPLWMSDMQLSKRIEPYERFFVDREPEWLTYKDMTIQLDQCIFCIEAKDGFGKTWLLRHLARTSQTISECTIVCVYVNLDKPEAKNAETLLRYIAQESADPFQSELLQAIESISRSLTIETTGDVHIDGDVVVGSKIVVNELNTDGQENITVQVQDPDAYARNVGKLTKALESSLNKFQSSGELVLLLDNFGKSTTDPTREWLVDVLAPKLQRGIISNLVIVLAGAERFDCFPDNDWEHIVVQRQLGGIPDDSIREYWINIRGLPEEHLKTILPLLNHIENSPVEMNTYADAIANKK